jgi:hypothetical protein
MHWERHDSNSGSFFVPFTDGSSLAHAEGIPHVLAVKPPATAAKKSNLDTTEGDTVDKVLRPTSKAWIVTTNRIVNKIMEEMDFMVKVIFSKTDSRSVHSSQLVSCKCLLAISAQLLLGCSADNAYRRPCRCGFFACFASRSMIQNTNQSIEITISTNVIGGRGVTYRYCTGKVLKSHKLWKKGKGCFQDLKVSPKKVSPLFGTFVSCLRSRGREVMR